MALFKLRLITALAIAAVVVLGFYYLTISNPESGSDKQTLPWVEVFKPKVTEKNRELKTGDELAGGQTVKTGPSGLADIHFADSSVVKVDSDTVFAVKEASFNKNSRTSIVSIFLESGKILSQVAALATPQSSWEVKTPNAVAAVRGTEYKVSYLGKETKVEVLKNSVAVSVVDPKTGKVIPGTEVVVPAGKTAEITEANVTAGTKPLIKGTDLSASPVKTATKTAPTAAPETLVIETQDNLTNVIEGDRVIFSAIAILPGGLKQNVSDKVFWQVIGPIGSIKSGIFTAQLDPSVSEAGSASGAVVAGWKDSASGKELTAQTPIFGVRAFVPGTVDRRG